MNNFITYVRESFDEVINRVSWPKYSELQSSTTLVVIASAIFAVVVAVIDLAFDNLLGLVY